MKRIYYCLCLFLLFSCEEKEETQFEDILIHFNYSIQLNDSNRITKYHKMYGNNMVIEIVDYTFKEQELIVETFYGNYLLAQKTVYDLESNGYASYSIDSIYGRQLRTVKNNYTYEDGYLTEIMGTIYYHEDTLIIDSVRFYEESDIENDGLSQVSNSYEPYRPCTDYYDNIDVVPEIDVINFNNGILGLNLKLPQSISLNNGCPCGPSSELGTKEYEYIFDDYNRIKKIKETLIYCHNKYVTPIKRQITTTEFTYHHFPN